MMLTLKSSPATASTKYAKGGILTVIFLPSSFTEGQPQEVRTKARTASHLVFFFITARLIMQEYPFAILPFARLVFFKVLAPVEAAVFIDQHFRELLTVRHDDGNTNGSLCTVT